jgi:hypothetical protein
MMRSLSEGSFRTAHFAFATSLSGLAATLAGMLSGSLQVVLGYPAFFAWTVVACAPALWVARAWSRKLGPRDSAVTPSLAPLPEPRDHETASA